MRVGTSLDEGAKIVASDKLPAALVEPRIVFVRCVVELDHGVVTRVDDDTVEAVAISRAHQDNVKRSALVVDDPCDEC